MNGTNVCHIAVDETAQHTGYTLLRFFKILFHLTFVFQNVAEGSSLQRHRDVSCYNRLFKRQLPLEFTGIITKFCFERSRSLSAGTEILLPDT